MFYNENTEHLESKLAENSQKEKLLPKYRKLRGQRAFDWKQK